MGDYNIEDIYAGTPSSFDPAYGSVLKGYGYRFSAGSFGMTTDPRTANVLQEVSTKLSSGAKQIELSTISPEIFDAIPKQDLKEVNRLSKLTGVDVSVHGPLVEPSGLSREGFSEANRDAAERQMIMAVERAHEVSPNGNVPVTFHSSAILPGPETEKIKRNGVTQEVVKGMLVIDPYSEAINKISLKEGHFPGEEKRDIEKELRDRNEEIWRESLTHLGFNVHRANSIIDESQFLALAKEAEEKAGKEITPREKEAVLNYNIGVSFLNDAYKGIKTLYDKTYNNVSENEKDILNNYAKKIRDSAENIIKNPNSTESIQKNREIVEEGLVVFSKLSVPEIFKPLDEFSREKTATTFGNVAFQSYKKFKDKAPIISIENPPAGGGFARAEDLKKIVEEAREKFVERAVKEGFSRGDAEKQAEKLIGVTWDVGHINMLRKQGFEEKDIIKETEKIAPYVKHIHLSDNFGFEHTELPMGMGNVPIKEIMEKLGKKGFEAKKIIEAASWWQHMKTPPLKESLAAIGSPIYAMKMGPYWNQAIGLQQDYLGGYGQMLPQINYETFGAGFVGLPMELGGQRAGGKGRMSGTPME